MTRPIPASSVTDSPLYCLKFNVEWMPYILEALQRVNYLSSWDGDDSERYAAQQQIELLMQSIAPYEASNMNALFQMYGTTSKTYVATGQYENLMTGAAMGSHILPANFWYPGRACHIRWHGRLVGTSADRTISMRMSINSTTIESIFANFTIAASSLHYVTIDATLYCESLTSNANLQCSGMTTMILDPQTNAATLEAFRVTNFTASASSAHNLQIGVLFTATSNSATVHGDYCLITDIAP